MGTFIPEPVQITSETGSLRPLVLKFGGSLVEQLGAQLYPSVTATVAELISNAWDADATDVWVSVPFEDDWTKDAELVVLDNGHGMTRAQAQEAYLVVGRRKRFTKLGDRSEGGRLVHGRKGIGKLAAFGTAGYLECTSLRQGATTSFGIDYDEVRRLNPDQDYFVDNVGDTEPLRSPDGILLDHGTRVRLTRLRVKRKISAETFQTAMSRRFALRGMNVFINGQPLKRFDIPLQFRLPRDVAPPGVSVDEDGWGTEVLASGDRVRWWIGFTEKPLVDGDQQGVSVLARDKMAQRPFKFERSQGTTAQLGFEYMVGEVHADWLDEGDDIDTDFIQSNRDQLQLENARLDEFMSWGRRRLSWALKTRQDLREAIVASQTEVDEELDTIIGKTTIRERRALMDVADKLARIPEMSQEKVHSIMRSVVDSRSDAQVSELVNEIVEQDDLDNVELRPLVSQFGIIDAERLTGIIAARVATLANLQSELARSTVRFDFRQLVRDDIWILDPRWHFYGSADLTIVIERLPQRYREKSALLKKLIILMPNEPAPLDEIVVVYAGTARPGINGSVISAIDQRDFVELAQIIRDLYQRDDRVPFLRGLMVGAGFETATAEITHAHGAQSALSFELWRDAIAASQAMHAGWLDVTRSRAFEGESE